MMGKRTIQIPTDEHRRLQAAESDLANVLLESVADKQKIEQLETDLGNTLLEIINIRMEV